MEKPRIKKNKNKKHISNPVGTEHPLGMRQKQIYRNGYGNKLWFIIHLSAGRCPWVLNLEVIIKKRPSCCFVFVWIYWRGNAVTICTFLPCVLTFWPQWEVTERRRDTLIPCATGGIHTHTHIFVPFLLSSLLQCERCQLLRSLLHQVDVADWIRQSLDDIWEQKRSLYPWAKTAPGTKHYI